VKEFCPSYGGFDHDHDYDYDNERGWTFAKFDSFAQNLVIQGTLVPVELRSDAPAAGDS